MLMEHGATSSLEERRWDVYKRQEIAEANPALYVSLRNQFIPAMEYTYTYDNASGRRIKNLSLIHI